MATNLTYANRVANLKLFVADVEQLYQDHLPKNHADKKTRNLVKKFVNKLRADGPRVVNLNATDRANYQTRFQNIESRLTGFQNDRTYDQLLAPERDHSKAIANAMGKLREQQAEVQ